MKMIGTSEAGHADVEDKAARALLGYLGEKVVARLENLVLEIHRVHKCLHGKANRRIVVDDKNGRFWFGL
jgi:hypothetical protein